MKKIFWTSETNYIALEAPHSQPIRYGDVVPEAASKWRAGVNLVPESFPEKMSCQLATELSDFGLAFCPATGEMPAHLQTTRSFAEGECIGHCGGLDFDSPENLAKFLALPNHALLQSHVFRIEKVIHGQVDEVKSTIFRVPTGIVRHLAPYQLLRRPPKCSFPTEPRRWLQRRIRRPLCSDTQRL